MIEGKKLLTGTSHPEKKCSLSIKRKSNIVAYGRVHTKNGPEQVVHGVALGEDNVPKAPVTTRTKCDKVEKPTTKGRKKRKVQVESVLKITTRSQSVSPKKLEKPHGKGVMTTKKLEKPHGKGVMTTVSPKKGGKPKTKGKKIVVDVQNKSTGYIRGKLHHVVAFFDEVKPLLSDKHRQLLDAMPFQKLFKAFLNKDVCQSDHSNLNTAILSIMSTYDGKGFKIGGKNLNFTTKDVALILGMTPKGESIDFEEKVSIKRNEEEWI
ncbi:hypothetical protein FRX31_008677, partial [Thalictrum thalictroides]